MIWPTIAVLISLAIAALITIPAAPPPRHHPYYCIYPGNGLMPPFSRPAPAP